MIDARITDIYRAWRAASLGDREVVEGITERPREAAGENARHALAEWDARHGAHYWDEYGGAQWLVLAREERAPRERWWLHALLLALTLATTTLGGIAIAGYKVDYHLMTFRALRAGMMFSLPLAAILLAHESGHYVTARRYKLNVSPPFFIPFPAAVNLLGTLGAFIRIRSPVFDRRTLFDIGVAGPLAGLVVALPVLFVGLALSNVTVVHAAPMAHQFLVFTDVPFFVGDSLIVLLARALLGIHGTVHLHPVAVAGWVGILVTTLNLLPLAQFDGGHITYAMSGRGQRIVAIYVLLALLALGVVWYGWWVWAVLAFIVGRGRLAHPEVLSPTRTLDRRRMALGWLALAIFIATFAPIPVSG